MLWCCTTGPLMLLLEIQTTQRSFCVNYTWCVISSSLHARRAPHHSIFSLEPTKAPTLCLACFLMCWERSTHGMQTITYWGTEHDGDTSPTVCILWKRFNVYSMVFLAHPQFYHPMYPLSYFMQSFHSFIYYTSTSHFSSFSRFFSLHYILFVIHF